MAEYVFLSVGVVENTKTNKNKQQTIQVDNKQHLFYFEIAVYVDLVDRLPHWSCCFACLLLVLRYLCLVPFAGFAVCFSCLLVVVVFLFSLLFAGAVYRWGRQCVFYLKVSSNKNQMVWQSAPGIQLEVYP